jgi:hypothetical protein
MATKRSAGKGRIAFVFLFSVTTAAVGAFPLPALAQGKDDVKEEAEDKAVEEAKAQARELFFDAVLLFDQGKYASALEKFSESYELHPHWKILYNIGMCYLEINDMPRAAEMLSQFLEGGGRKIKEELIEEVAGTLKKVKSKVGTLRLTGHYKGGVLTINGVENHRGAKGKDVFLTPGVHHVKLTGGEVVLLDTKVTIEAGEEKEIFVVKHEWSGITKKDEPPPKDDELLLAEEKEKAKKKKLKSGGWALFGVGLAALAAGFAMGGLALAKKKDVVGAEDRFMDECNLISCPEEWSDDLDSLKNERNTLYDEAMGYSIASTVLISAGGAAAFVSMVLLPLAYRKTGAEKKPEVEKKANLDLHLGPGSMELSWHF